MTERISPVRPPRARRLSPLRLAIAIVVTSAVVTGGALWAKGAVSEALAPTVSAPWFAGYVDVTTTPAYAFETPVNTAGSNVVLSFVVSDARDACTPSWGSAYTLDEAATSLDLDRRIARLQQDKGQVVVSFGGQANSELSVGCTDPTALESAYASVVARYDLSTIDLDLEGGSLDAAAVERGAAAIAALQKTQRADGENLAVWLTLPVTPDGLATSGTDAVAAYLKAGVDLAGVNAMTMDYGDSLASGVSMIAGTESALTQLHRQLGILYTNAGTNLTDATVWSKIGTTPMVGQNDDADERFTIAAAKTLSRFARDKGIGRVSMWSLNRDATCGPNYAELTTVSTVCSGVDQDGVSFATVLGAHLHGSPIAASGETTTPEPVASTTADDPATSPYQIWKSGAVYLAGTKVVWHHNVYQAKWWTRGDTPDDAVLQASDTPWTLIGPVLPGETPVAVPTVAPGSYPTWAGAEVYTAGERVMLDGIAYEAKWWTQGDSPEAASDDPDVSPWIALTPAQIAAVNEGTAG